MFDGITTKKQSPPGYVNRETMSLQHSLNFAEKFERTWEPSHRNSSHAQAKKLGGRSQLPCGTILCW